MESTRASLLIAMATAWIGAAGAGAQTAPPPSTTPEVIPLEQISGEPPGTPPAPTAPRAVPARPPAIQPSSQRPDYRSLGGHAALRQLRNPFEGACGPERRGLFGRARSRPAPVPAAPPAGAVPPYAAPGTAGIPAPAPAPTSAGPAPTEVPGPTAAPAAPPGAAPPSGTPPTPGAPGPPAGAPTSPAPAPTTPPTGTPAAPAAPGATTPPATTPAPSATGTTPAPSGMTAPGSGAAGSASTTPSSASTTPSSTTTPSTSTSGSDTSSTSASDLFGGSNNTGNTGNTADTGFGGAAATAPTPFAMIGNIVPFTSHVAYAHTRATTPPIPSPVPPPGPPPPPGARGATPIYPSVRNFNISEDQSPRPQDRIFFNFNYYNNMNDAINARDLSPVTQMKAYVYNFGVEKTFNDGMGSIGVHLPLDNLTANSVGNIVGTPTSTSLGNLSIFGKYILAQNRETGSLVSALFAVTPQSGPSRFAGAPYLFPLNSTTFQPCLGYIYNRDRLYLQGFSGFSFSANPNDVSLLYNDLAVGYFLYRDRESRSWLTAVAPTFEVHVNNPINHRDWFDRSDLAGTPDSVNLTYGLNLGIRNTAVLTTAFVTPVTTPKPFDCEAVLMLNVFFGRTRSRMLPPTPPPL